MKTYHAYNRAFTILWVTALALTAAGCSKPQREDSGSPTELSCVADAGQSPEVLLDLGPSEAVLVRGGLLRREADWVVAGYEEATTSRGDSQRMRFLSSRGSLFGSPPELGDDQLAAVAPVVTADGIGLLWASGPSLGSPSPGVERYRDLFLSVRTARGWLPARRIARAGQRLGWPAGRTLRYSAEHGTLLMLLREDHAMERAVLFGALSGELRPVPLPTDFSPYGGSFVVGDSDTIVAVLQIGPSSGDPKVMSTFGMTISGDGGHTWSAMRHIDLPSNVANDIRLHRDRDGMLHLLWIEGTTVRHARQVGSSDFWVEVSLPSPPVSRMLLGAASGFGSAGSLMLLRESVARNGEADLLATCFGADEWAPYERLPFSAHYIHDALDLDGSWAVSWTGVRDGVASSHLSVWGWAP